MKNLAKVLVMTLLVGLFGVVAVSSLLATPSVQTPLVATTSYNAETGIRWNEGFGVFEVFNSNGVSYIASGEQFNAIGEKYNSEDHGSLTGFETADGNQRYHIMQDIAYDETSVGLNAAFVDQGTRYEILSSGIVDGRGFILKDFPVSVTAGTALFSSNAGTIVNVKVVDPVITDEATDVGILCKTNNNIIDNCEVSGTAIVLSSSASIASIAFSGGGIIRNCTNKLDITTGGELVAGILAQAEDAIINNCMNIAHIKSTSANGVAGGIVGTTIRGSVQNSINFGNIEANDAGGILGGCDSSTIKGNKNYGTITGTESAFGIVGGQTTVIVEDGNFNYGVYSKNAAAYGNIHGVAYGIRFAGLTDGGIARFEVFHAVGISYICSNYAFSTGGKSLGPNPQEGTVDVDYAFASNSAIYEIINDIDYRTPEYFFTPSPVAITGTAKVIGKNRGVEGASVELTNFPIRKIGSSTTYSALFASVAGGAEVKNINLTTNTREPDGDTGILTYINDGLIENCTVSGNISTTKFANIGGIAYTATNAASNPIFKNCTNKANIVALANTMGGIVGITASSSGTTEFSGCINEGTLSASGGTDNMGLGGIVGQVNTAFFTNCKNNGVLSLSGSDQPGTRNIGGIVGAASGNVRIERCISAGSVFLHTGTTGSSASLGGILGNGASGALILDSTVQESVTVGWLGRNTWSAVGGIAGVLGISSASWGSVSYGDDGTVVLGVIGTFVANCIFEGTVMLGHAGSGVLRVGGLFGYSNLWTTGGLVVTDCESKGRFLLEEYSSTLTNTRIRIGGAFGVIYNGVSGVDFKLENFVSSMDIIYSRAGEYFGGIIGSAEGSTDLLLTFSNIKFTGNISATKAVGFEGENTGTFAGLFTGFTVNGTLTVSGGGTATSGLYVGNDPNSGYGEGD